MSDSESASDTALTLPKRITKLSDVDLHALIKRRAKDRYGDNAKDIQISAVMDLVKRRNSFVLAGTGFGKTRIAEMYWDLFPKYKKSIVLCLNPLDSFGDNQVEEKNKAKKPISAVNLTKMNLTVEVVKDIMEGEYSFIYLSPEVLLNNALFHELFFDHNFQDQLISTVVDEAHMVYMWGLVASGKAKKIISHLKHQDRAIFRPSYGKLGSKLVLTNGVPLLLLSATCRPVAVTGILKILKLKRENVFFSKAELTRPEIRIIRIPMESSFKSCDDLGQLFGPREKTPDEKVVPSLIYSTTWALTMQALKVINTARGTTGGQNNPFSSFARRYHSCTGDLTKGDTIKDFASDKVAVMLCTMALGLGQNWKRVWMVAHFGRGDPASLFQMIGRCGQDGKPGLAIMFVEPNRKHGKNCIEDFEDDEPMAQTEDDRMDALAITPVCLRVVYSLDNLLGYVPLKEDDPNVILEKKRETDSKFDPCGCSNCKPTETSVIMRNLKHLDVDNFTSFMESPEDILAPPLDPAPDACSVAKVSRPSGLKKPLVGGLEEFATYLYSQFEDFFAAKYNLEASYSTVDDVFNIQDARIAVLATEKGYSRDCIDKLIGSEMVTGQAELLHSCIEDYQATEAYQEYTCLRNLKKNPRSNAQSKSQQPLNQAARNLDHLDPSLFQSTLNLLQAPKKTKKQQIAEDNKRRTAAKREMKKAQKAVDDQKKKEEAQKKLEEKSKRKVDDEKERKAKLAKRKAEKEAKDASQAKRKRTTLGELVNFRSGQT
ncbi:hypothetical protein PTTG_08117 [Puccinia triticina 1-1 BBBD Race 1]|uniref:DNA 3'-5' helicase n=1 Tax=Puccinia triticina (isolate 1-1 / race 1 (BBBD)) TaxID=630390 RepID=A0A180GF32_PUCT1|nr:hypothetical protein PTTG_08117 [Puccinia triticina 1-1 BBBD Race 1]